MGNADLIKRLRETQDLYEKAGVDGAEGALQAKEAADALEAHEWRTDMKNAPRDGRHIMAMCGDEWPVSVYWQAYSAEDAAEAGAPGYWDYSEELLSMHVEDVEPCAWKHLDTPPDAQNT